MAGPEQVDPRTVGLETWLAEAGRRPEWTHGLINPPVHRASTIVFRTYADYLAASAQPDRGMTYPTRGTPSSWALEEALTGLEPGAAGTRLMSSGLAAVAAALLSVVKAGDHVLVSDSVYDPTRRLCNGLLKRFGIETSYYDPRAGAEIAAVMQPNTRAIVVETPGSLTFEVQDVPAIAAVAHAAGAVVIADNTWATPLYYPALSRGVDLSVHALTKYVCGHADGLLGAVTANARCWPALLATCLDLGQCAAPDDATLALRGLRTMKLRLDQHDANARAIAAWLEGHPAVTRVIHPALPSHPDHGLWVRDFSGAAGLFAIELVPMPDDALARLLDGLKHFVMGYSWGGYESVILPVRPEKLRTAVPYARSGPMLRLHIGLESVDDLNADLAAALARAQQR